MELRVRTFEIAEDGDVHHDAGEMYSYLWSDELGQYVELAPGTVISVDGDRVKPIGVGKASALKMGEV